MTQEYDFYIEHIAGKANIVADGFSRLLPLREEHLYLHDEFAPSEKDYQTIATTHNEVVGHHGVERTMEKQKAKGKHWSTCESMSSGISASVPAARR